MNQELFELVRNVEEADNTVEVVKRLLANNDFSTETIMILIDALIEAATAQEILWQAAERIDEYQGKYKNRLEARAAYMRQRAAVLSKLSETQDEL